MGDLQEQQRQQPSVDIKRMKLVDESICVNSRVNLVEGTEEDKKYDNKFTFQFKCSTWVYGLFTVRSQQTYKSYMRLTRPLKGFVNKLYIDNYIKKANSNFGGSLINSLVSMMIDNDQEDLTYDIKEIQLFSCYINMEDIDVLCKLITGSFRPNNGRVHNIKSLQIMDCGLTNVMIKKLCNAMSNQDSCVTEFIYCHNQAKEVPGLQSVANDMAALITNNKLIKLVVGDLIFTKEEVNIILQATCSERSKVEVLNMNSNNITDESLNDIERALTCPTNSLRKLYIDENDFTTPSDESKEMWEKRHRDQGTSPIPEYPPDHIVNIIQHENFKLEVFEI